jgi:hypothetical protein
VLELGLFFSHLAFGSCVVFSFDLMRVSVVRKFSSWGVGVVACLFLVFARIGAQATWKGWNPSLAFLTALIGVLFLDRGAFAI